MTTPLILVESSQSLPRRIPLAGDIRKKRALPVEPLGGTPNDERKTSSKKPCLQSTLRPTWNPSTFPIESSPDTSPTSQLFVSLSTWRRPPLPPRFWSSEAGAAMPTRTITLAQGTIDTGSSPPTIIPTRATPETGDGSSGMQILSQIGIIEMLEQDERPTFIIDLGDPAILISGPLHVPFANAALRSCQGFLDLITGKADQASPLLSITTTFPEFKAWSTGIVKDHERTGVPLSSFLYAGVTWTYSTLRRRLRFVSGTSVPAFAKSKSVFEGRLAPTLVLNGLWESPTSVKVDLSELEAPDYFGAAPVQDCAETVIEGTRSGTASGIESPETSACNQDSAFFNTIPNDQVARSPRSNHNGRLSDFSPLSMHPNEAVPAMDGSVHDVSHGSESLDQG
ncbi:MAG: hypothetical protein M1830_006182, partial [Pleopsidium flavum]